LAFSPEQIDGIVRLSDGAGLAFLLICTVDMTATPQFDPSPAFSWPFDLILCIRKGCKLVLMNAHQQDLRPVLDAVQEYGGGRISISRFIGRYPGEEKGSRSIRRR
jgi:hypothetical protein